MIEIPYSFSGKVEYQTYQEIEERIKKFDRYYNIGNDASGKYDMYVIELGTREKPNIFMMSTIHGTEWHTTQYSMEFMEQLRDNTFPDKDFRDFLLNNFHIAYIPVANPWGLDNNDDIYQQFGNNARFNSNGVDMNRDYYDFTQVESRNVASQIDKYKPFAFLDMHMFQPDYDSASGRNLIIANSSRSTENVRDEWVESMEAYAGQEMTVWWNPPTPDEQSGLARRYASRQDNPHTPETLAYITELVRPARKDGEIVEKLTPQEIHKFGMADIYLFFKTSIQYYMENFKTQDYDPQIVYVRDLEGNEYHLQATTTHDIELNGNQSLSFTVLPSETNREFIGDLSEMWEVIDDKGVVHKIVYCKQKGRGNLKYNYTPAQKGSFLSPVQTVESREEKRELVKNMTVEVKAIPKFFDDMDNSRIYDEYNEHMTAHRAFTRIFEGTPFNFILVGSFSSVEWEGFGGGESRLETFKRALNRYKMEFRIEGNIVYLEHQIGRDTQFQYRYRLNASNIVKEIDAGEFWTYARGYGDYEGGEDEGWEHANIQMDYTSPLAKVVGKREAPPIKDGRIKKKSTMEQSLKELVDESLMISISTDIHDLRKQGYALAQPEVGDRVFIVDERIGLDEEIRITDISVTKDWKGNVIDLKLTVGSGNLSKRHQSNLNTAAKELSDVLSGKKTFPYSVLDEAVKNATEALQNTQTELDFTGNGIIARDKTNPNNLTIFNSAGIGVSTDGGGTFEQAITGEGINASTIVTGTMVADFIAGGVLASLNGNTDFNLNTGELIMKQANFKLGGSANIEFTNRNNRLFYTNRDIYAGIQFDHSLGTDGNPFIGIGVSDHSHNVNDETFRGIRIHSLGTEGSQGFGVNVVSQNFGVYSRADLSGSGYLFRLHALDGKKRGIIPQNTGSYNYDLGSANNMWDRFYIKGNMYNNGETLLTDEWGVGGWSIGTRAESGKTTITLRGINTDERNYNLGASGYRINKIFLSNSPDISSDERLKKEIKDNKLGLDFINDLETKTFKLKKEDDVNKRRFGIIAQQLVNSLENNGINTNDHSMVNKGEDGFYGVQNEQLITPIIKSIQELSQRIEQLEARING